MFIPGSLTAMRLHAKYIVVEHSSTHLADTHSNVLPGLLLCIVYLLIVFLLSIHMSPTSRTETQQRMLVVSKVDIWQQVSRQLSRINSDNGVIT
jgi:hypothetical protein